MESAPTNPATQLVYDLEKFANTFSHSERAQDFLKAFQSVHNSNQQNIFRLMMKLLEFFASPEFRSDSRNQASKHIAQVLLAGFQKKMGEGAKPSNYIPFI